MANERLRTAMAVARIDLDAIVEATEVDPKTVQRWINGRIPNARHRSKLVQLVGEEEIYLWPEILDGERARAASESQLAALYPHRADVPADLWPELFRRAERSIDILVYAAVFLHEQDLISTTCCGRKQLPAARSASRSATRLAIASRRVGRTSASAMASLRVASLR